MGGSLADQSAWENRKASGTKPRHQWVDIAKAISIMLVVLLHIFGKNYEINALLGYARMPLFFFVAGFFSVKALSGSWREVMTDKVMHFMYLYILWEVILFFVFVLPVSHIKGEDADYDFLLNIFHNPPLALWFIYALAVIFLISKLLYKIGIKNFLAISLLCYGISIYQDVWSGVSFPDKIARLLPYFLIGGITFKCISSNIGKYYKMWPILFLSYFIASYAISHNGLAYIPVFSFGVSAVGIASILFVSFSIQNTILSGLMNYIGARTIQIYVLHQVLARYFKLALAELGGMSVDVLNTLVFLATIVCSLALGAVLNRYFPWLFNAPWKLSAKEKTSGVQQSSAA